MQVNRCNSFLEHLVMIQMEQRAVAYDMSGKLHHLRRSVRCLKKLYSVSHSVGGGNTDEVNVSTSQQILFRCMWQQKVRVCSPGVLEVISLYFIFPFLVLRL